MKTCSSLSLAAVVCAFAGSAFAGVTLDLQPQAAPEPAAAQPDAVPPSTLMSPTATFTFSKERLHDDPEILWPGFINGLRGFEHFYNPVGNPLYFETPLNNTSAKVLFLHHEFSDKSQLVGGQVNVVAVQARIALTERLGFIATKDGYSWLDTGALGKSEGWNSVAAGLKYAIIADKENDLVVTPGFRLMFNSGEGKILQSGTTEFSPFVSVAKGWDKFHVMGNFTARVPTDGNDGNDIIQWDLHADYEILDGLAPIVELHGLHYLDNGTRAPFSVGGLDYTNLGSADVSGSSVIWFGVGARWKLTPHLSLGSTYEHSLTNQNADIFEQRVTVDLELTW
ncbi:MAG: hypothetical protein WC718_12730 [Phycisphaerales bacterium]|jgi:hypothetical protein